jgi:serine/threonine protein kinase HipA of HipAB toxin-antitoxin module
VRDRSYPDPFARYAVLALRDQGTPVARAKLVELLELAATRRNILATIYDSVAELCIREAAPTLIKHLQSPSIAGIARNDLLTALGNIGGADAINAIKQAAKLSRGEADRTEFAWALARAGDRSMMPAIVTKGCS